MRPSPRSFEQMDVINLISKTDGLPDGQSTFNFSPSERD